MRTYIFEFDVVLRCGCMMRKHLSIIIVVAILLGAVVLTAGCASNVNNTPTPSIASPTRDPKFVPKNTSGYLTYTNSSAGISIQYVSSWQKNESTDGAVVSFNTNGVNVSYTVATPLSVAGSGYTLNDFADYQLQATQLLEFKLLNSTNSTLSGYPAQQRVFTFMNDDASFSQGILKVTLVNSTGYAVLYVAQQSLYPSYLGIAQNMTQSFNITK